jgi:hypothetical protein
MTKAMSAVAETPKKRNSARKSKPKKPKKKPNGIDLSGIEKEAAAKAGLPITGTTDRGIIALPEHLTEPGNGIAQMGRVDLVAQL